MMNQAATNNKVFYSVEVEVVTEKKPVSWKEERERKRKEREEKQRE